MLTQVSWPDGGPDGARVAYGAYDQLRYLCQASWGGQTLSAFLTASDVVKAVLGLQGLLLASELYYDSYYEQPDGVGSELQGQPAAASVGPLRDIWDWLQEAAAQHSGSNYLHLLGAPPVQGDLVAGPVPRLEPGAVPPPIVLRPADAAPVSAQPVPLPSTR